MIINRDCSVEGAHWRVFPLPVFSGYRVVARYDVEHRIKCGMMRRRGPEKCLLWVLPLPVFSGFRIKCGMTRNSGMP